MKEPSSHYSGLKKDWVLTTEAFQRLLGWLDGGADSDGRTYLDIRSRLIAYFDRKNCVFPDDLADETLNRVARRLTEEKAIDAEVPAKYCYIVAKFVFMETLRRKENTNVPFDGVKEAVLFTSSSNEEADSRERMLTCLEDCTSKLEPASRELIFRYYSGEQRERIENRRRMAKHLGISVNALSIRAFRIRDKLERCVGKCVGS
jgi:DNA-directed RNA polymerase specialized sigma24 family protein